MVSGNAAGDAPKPITVVKASRKSRAARAAHDRNYVKLLVEWTRGRIPGFLEGQWKTLAGWGISGWVALASRWARELLPLPEELLAKGALWWCLFSMPVVLLAATHSIAVHDASPTRRRAHFLVLLMAYQLGFTVIFPALFESLEWWWKQPDAPTEFIFGFLEPRIFGLNFACLTGFACYALYLTFDIYHAMKGDSSTAVGAGGQREVRPPTVGPAIGDDQVATAGQDSPAGIDRTPVTRDSAEEAISGMATPTPTGPMANDPTSIP